MGFFTKDIKTMNDLFMHGLQDLYYAENQIAKSLPDMIEKATNPQLRAGFEKHLSETKGQIERVEQMFRLLDADAKGEKKTQSGGKKRAASTARRKRKPQARPTKAKRNGGKKARRRA